MKTIPVFSFEIDSYYKRNQTLKDSKNSLNKEVNVKIQKAIEYTKSCSTEDLYTNVRNQINADSAGFGVIGGLEGWCEKEGNLDKINPPPSDQSIYYGTSFESITSMGFWLHLYNSSASFISKNTLKAKIKIRKIIDKTNDPIILCKVPPELQEAARRILLQGNAPGGGGPPPSGMGGGPPGSRPDLDKCGPPAPNKEMHEEMEKMMEVMKKLNENNIMNCIMTAANKKMPEQGGNLESMIDVSGHRIGCDKLGHFFDQGQEYFKEAYKITGSQIAPIQNGLQKALDHGKSQEEGMYGLSGTGVKSYGDLSANYGGLLFWENLAQSENPIVKCVDGKFKQLRDFDFNEYVTDAWDEGTNCSDYKSTEFKSNVEKNLKLLSTSCPAEEKKCIALADQYPTEVLKEIIGPTCTQMIAKAKGVK